MAPRGHAFFVIDSFLLLLYHPPMIHIPPRVKRFAGHFHDAGHELYIVGGAVRDALRKERNSDYDFATSATPQEVMDLFPRVIPTGIQHGTVTVMFQGEPYEVTTYRIEHGYSDSRHPDAVSFTRSLHEDLSRRDLTINAMALDPRTGTVVDPFGGRDDLRDRRIRTVGSARERFSEDALRMVRAVRFTTTLRFDPEPDVESAIIVLAPTVAAVSVERIAAEFEKMMRAETPSLGWMMLWRTGLLAKIIPEILESTAVDGLVEHLFRSCDCSPPDQPHLRWAALLHDIGKPRCSGQDKRGQHFIGHDEESARMAETLLQRLRFPKQFTTRVVHLVRHHMFDYSPDYSDSAVRRLIARVGVDAIHDLIRLRRADTCGKSGHLPTHSVMDELQDRIHRIIAANAVLTRSDLAVNGKDLMQYANIPAGPVVGMVLEELLETVLDDPELNTRERLLSIAGTFAAQRLGRDPQESKSAL